MHNLPIHPWLVHPRTGAPLRAVGIGKRGPIWPIIGGDGTEGDANDKDADDQDGADESDADADDTDDESEELGPKGVKALQTMKDKERAARKELREWKALGLTPAQIKEMQAKDAGGDQADPEEIRKQAKAEAKAEALRDRVTDKIEAKAARSFADAEDAVAILLRSRDIEDFITDDKIDVDEIADALKELGEKKPHLLAQGKKFQGSADGGARKESKKSIDDQIAEAEKARNFQLAIALKQQRAALANK